MYVFINSEKGLWTVGHYAPNGKFVPESDWDVEEKAAERVSFLNGGGGSEFGREDVEAILRQYALIG